MVFPSLGDVWGIAVNEAMTCGLPVLCSSLAGCAEDLITPGRDGWLADPRDTEAFSAALLEALTCGQRRRMGQCAREKAERFAPEAMAEGLRRAVRQALTTQARA
jgi:glycosyltransferase involved in cell wall biosynthesis